MVNTLGREPTDTVKAIGILIETARINRFIPHTLLLGFFNVRDVMKASGFEARHYRAADEVGPARINGIPYRVMSLEDGIVLQFKRAGDPFGMPGHLHWAPANNGDVSL